VEEREGSPMVGVWLLL